MPNAMEMPRYRSHKTVHALEIWKVDFVSPKSIIHFNDGSYEPVEAEPSMFARYVPVEGDFYVVYPDGYKAISPRKAFLEGYDKLI